MLVLDASVVVEALTGTNQSSIAIWGRIDGHPTLAPELLDVEVTHTIRGLHRGGRLPLDVAEAALHHLARLPIERAPHLPFLPRVWELRDNFTAYDAMYVALAESLDATLITMDRRLSDAPGRRCTIELIS